MFGSEKTSLILNFKFENKVDKQLFALINGMRLTRARALRQMEPARGRWCVKTNASTDSLPCWKVFSSIAATRTDSEVFLSSFQNRDCRWKDAGHPTPKSTQTSRVKLRLVYRKQRQACQVWLHIMLFHRWDQMSSIHIAYKIKYQHFSIMKMMIFSLFLLTKSICLCLQSVLNECF